MNERPSKLDGFYRFALGAYLFTLVLAMYFGTNDPTIHIKELLSSWAAGALAGTYMLACWLTGRPLRRPAIFAEVLLCLLAFLLIGTLFSELFRFSLLETGQFFSLFALYWLASQIYKTPEQVLRLFAVFCAAVFVAGLYAVLQQAGLDPMPWEDRQSDTYTNLPATFGNPNYAAHAIILALIMIVCLVRSGRTWAGWLFMPVLLFHLYSTDQRAGWIALAGAAVLAGIAWLIMRRARRPLLAATASLLIFAILGVSAVGGAMYLTHLRTGHVFPLDLSLLLRYQSYVSATNMVFDAPLVGHGPAVYSQAYPAWWTPYEQDWFAQEVRMNEHVHNDLLELAIDGGLAAAGMYLALIVLGIGSGLLLIAKGTDSAYRRLGYAFAAFFAAFAIDGLFGFNLRVPVTAALFFIMMGLLDGIWHTGARPPEDRPRRRMLGYTLRVAFLLLLFFTTWQETRRFVSEIYYQAGSEARAEGDYDSAMAAYQQAAGYAPWNWEIPGQMGLVALDRGDGEAALDYFASSLELNPHAFLTHLTAARAHLLEARERAAKEDVDLEAAVAALDRARERARKVFDVAPDFPAANDLLGRVESIAAILKRDHAPAIDPEVSRDHWRRARDYFQAALDQGSENPGELYRMQMRVETALGNLDAAERALERALEVAPEERQTWNMFMKFAREHDRFAQFQRTLYRRIKELEEQEDRSKAEETQLVDAYMWLAVVQEQAFDDIEGAGTALARAAARAPRRADLWNRFATYAQKHNQSERLKASLLDAMDQAEAGGQPALPQVRAVATALRNPEENLGEATKRLLAAVRGHPEPGSLSMLMRFAWAATMLKDIYDQQYEAGTAPCESALDLGIMAATLGERNVASTLFERAMGCLEGEHRAAAAVHWADTLVREGNPTQALEILREAAAEFPGHLDTQWAIARALVVAGQFEEGRATYQTLLQNPALRPQAKGQIQQELDELEQALRKRSNAPGA